MGGREFDDEEPAQTSATSKVSGRESEGGEIGGMGGWLDPEGWDYNAVSKLTKTAQAGSSLKDRRHRPPLIFFTEKIPWTGSEKDCAGMGLISNGSQSGEVTDVLRQSTKY